MSHVLSTLRAKLLGPQDDSDIIAKYVGAVYGYARREGMLPLTVETLTRYVIFDMPTDMIRSLLAAYGVKTDPAAFTVVAAEPSSDSKDVSPDVAQIVARALFMAKGSGKRARIVDPAEVLVSLAMHPKSAPILEQFGLTKLKITYFLSHGRALPASRDDEFQDLPERSGEAFVRIKNDDYTPVEFVTKVLRDVFDLGTEHAQQAMWMIHLHREAFLGPYSHEDAHERAARALAVVREAGEPLLLSLARDNSITLPDALRDAKHRRLRRISAKQGRPIGFIRQHWRGERSFASAFWSAGVIGSVVLWYGFAMLLSKAMLHASPRAFLELALATLAFFIVAFTWQWTGIWRAAGKYKTTKWRTYMGTFAQAAMALVVIGSIGLAVRALPYLQDVGRVFSDSQPVPRYSIALESGDTVAFTGGFRLGASRSLIRMLDAHPEVRIVRLHSPGGLAAEGALMRNLIQERGLITHVSGACASACASAYLGGSRRYLSECGRLVFHRTRHGFQPNAPESSYSASFLLGQSGISQSFIDRVANTPSTSGWAPTHDELLEAGVVHEIGEPSKSSE